MRRMSILAGAILAAASLATASFGQTGFAPATAGDDKAGSPNGQPARGQVVDDLVAKGFEVVRDTSVVGDFDGCEQDRQVSLKMGGLFTCAGFGYMHAHNPKAVLLKKKGANQYKLVIEHAVFDGVFAYS
jgi:hypothetical protein